MARKKLNYSLERNQASKHISAPALPYLPRDPRTYRPNIGLIGCGGITKAHLTAYKNAGYKVVALCDISEARAKERQKEFFPKADIYSDFKKLLKRDDIEVVDIATHPEIRPAIVRDALKAGKHVLSQKPFVLDLDEGERLVELADKQKVLLAVNQNGRWAPHLSYIRNAIQKKLIGDITAVTFNLNWDHTWTSKTPFNNVHHLIMYDFGIHWFDALSSFLPKDKPRKVFACKTYVRGQKCKPPMLGQALVEFDHSQANLCFDGHSMFGNSDRTLVTGSKGSLESSGPNLEKQTVKLFTAKGIAQPKLKGTWFTNGFHGTMAELLCAIEEQRQPLNSARDNLKSLAICFAALKSADTDKPVIPGKVRRISK